jgi:Rrf2 family protein
MILTHGVSYAIHAVVFLAGQLDGVHSASQEIARKIGAPERFILKVLLPLVAAGILSSLKGPYGGYRLARPAGRISLLEIIEAVGGPLRNQYDQNDRPENVAVDRRVRAVFDEMNQSMRVELAKVRISDLRRRSRTRD